MITNRNYSPYSSALTEKFRHKFEAMTGVDCSDFYKDNMLRQIVAVGALENFLDRTETKRYAEGQRYFFGRPIG